MPLDDDIPRGARSWAKEIVVYNKQRGLRQLANLLLQAESCLGGGKRTQSSLLRLNPSYSPGVPLLGHVIGPPSRGRCSGKHLSLKARKADDGHRRRAQDLGSPNPFEKC